MRANLLAVKIGPEIGWGKFARRDKVTGLTIADQGRNDAPTNDGSDQLADLIQRIGQGDRAAFDQLYETTVSTLYAQAIRVCRRRTMADDVIQEAYIRVWRHAAQYDRSRGNPMAWLTIIVRRLALDALRQSNRHILDSDDPRGDQPDDAASPLDQAVLTLDQRLVHRCLNLLQAMQRQCLLLAYFEDLTHAEVSCKLKIPLGSVKSYIRRGLQQLKICMAA